MIKSLDDFLKESGEYLKVRDILKKRSKKRSAAIGIYGCTDASKGHMVHSVGEEYDFRIFITINEQKARQYCEDLKNFEEDVWYYPARDLLFYNADIQGKEITAQRMMVISRIIEYGKGTIVTSIDGLMDAIMPLSYIKKHVLFINQDDTVNLSDLKKHLTRMGYENCPRVESPGQFSVRGGILDIFTLTDDNPVRMELWGDEVDTLKFFDADTQRSLDYGPENLKIYPAAEIILDEGSTYAGLDKIKKESEKCIAAFRKSMQTEEAFRLEKEINSLIEDMKTGIVTDAANSFLRYFFDEYESFIDYFSDSTCVFMDEPVYIEERCRVIYNEFAESMKIRLEKGYIIPGQAETLFTEKEIINKIEKYPFLVLGGINTKNKFVDVSFDVEIISRNVSSYKNHIGELIDDLRYFTKNKYKIVLITASRTRAGRIAENLRNDYGFLVDYSEKENLIPKEGRILVLTGKLSRGFEYPALRAVVITENDMFGARGINKKKRTAQSSGVSIQRLKELVPGDYVVHESYGIGKYVGIEKIENQGVTKDYLKVEYQGGNSLYVPITQLDIVQKYASSDVKTSPKLSKIGGKEWKNTHSRVKSAVQEVAKELVTLYAARESKKGFEYGPDTVWQTEFEEMFPYEETDDQLEAIKAVKNDMESSRIMDRLVCGDVGFGKTEIAIRAAFKAVQENKQVVYLCPTTILAQQHYNTFSERMSKYPVRVDLLCRFKTPASQRQTLKDLKSGLVDILIGTHRVLSKDVIYKDLGLLIIDEEQRFGVKHKEKIKQLKNTVDVLTLTATPIPRTLHMSLIGIRDLSMLEQAPLDRTPIQTYVMEHDDEIIREAINRELVRGGQVYYVYNSVENIDSVASKLQKLLPDANIAFAHGQMNKRQLEDIMLGFINGEIDILVATTIIETGLDIPNVNTIIIQDAHKLGLSQLYQLRGRVGRSNRTSYAFITYTRGKVLSEVAEKRLEAIKQFTELGSGVKIAMRDLQIRGAGTVLGSSQSGHLEAVGYDLYCKMLNIAIKNLKEDKDEDIYQTFETQIDMVIDAFIPPSYITNEQQKLEMYKRIATVEEEADYTDVLDELIDRFGDVPLPVNNLLQVALLKSKAHKNYITDIRSTPDFIEIKILKEAPVDNSEYIKFINSFNGSLTLVKGNKFHFIYKEDNKNKMESVEQIIVMNSFLDKMGKELS